MTRKCVTDEQYGQLSRRVGELLRRTDEGTLPFNWVMDDLQRLIEGRFEQTSPLFSKNEHGHYILTITGSDRTGLEEYQYLESLGFRIGTYAGQVLGSDEYNQYHRLEAGKLYTVVLIQGKEVRHNRATKNLRVYAEQFGYQKPLAGIMPRVREAISDQQMEKELEGIWYIASLHDPIRDSDGDPNVLSALRGDDGRWLGSYWGNPDREWNDAGAFAFLVP